MTVTSEETKKRISDALKATKERRKSQECRVFEVKIDYPHLPPKTQDALRRLFLEAKWFYNACLSSENPTKFPETVREVSVKKGDVFEIRPLTILSAQMKQGLLSRIGDSLRALSVLKSHGRKVGRLKFSAYFTSIPLKQFGQTYRILDARKIAIQNLPGSLRAFGLKQLDGYEVANANLVSRAGDYYLMVTCFRAKASPSEPPFSSIGLDFNVSAGNQIVLSNAIAVGFSVPESRAVKDRQRKLARQDRQNKKAGRTGKTNHTRNRNKTRIKLQKAHLQQNRVKKEIGNQTIHCLKAGFAQVCIQDDSIKGWQKRYGKQVRNTALGRILVKLKKSPTTRVVPRFVATSSPCSVCHVKNTALTLNQEWWTCPVCSTVHNRHVNAAVNTQQIGSERAESTPVEKESSAQWLLEQFQRLNLKHLRVRLLQRNRNPKGDDGKPLALSSG